MLLKLLKPPIPEGWEHIDYVSFEKEKEDYIDLGIVPDKYTKVEMIVMGMHNDFSHDRFFGVDGVFLMGFMPFGNYEAGGGYFVYNKNEVSKQFGTYPVNWTYWVKFVKDGIHNHATVLYPDKPRLEVEMPDNAPSSLDFTTTKTMWAGRANAVTGWAVHSNRIQYIKIWKSGELVGYFIPIHKDTVDALYNTVTKVIHYKNG